MEFQHHTILIVEDEAITGIEIQRSLAKHGFKILPIVDSGVLALKAATEHHPDLVLMDIGLAGELDGITVAELLSARSDTPVIFLTARTDDATFERALATAPYGYIQKPFTDRELFTAVETALQRSALEARLRESEARYRSLYNTTPAMLHSVAEDGTIISVNDYWLEKMEYAREEVIGHSITEFMSTISRSQVLHKAPMVVPDDAPSVIECQFVSKFGSRIDVLMSSMPDQEHDGRRTSSVVMQDVTETKRVKESVAYGQNLLATIIEAIPYPIYVKDPDHKFLLVNHKSAEALHVKSPQELIGKSDRDLFPLKQALASDTAEDEIMRTGRPMLATEYVRRHPVTGEITHCLQVSKVPFYDASGVIAGVVGINHDITEQKQAEETLRLSEERYRRLFEESKDAVFILSHHGRFIDVNHAGVDLLGYESKEELCAVDLRTSLVSDERSLIAIRDELQAKFFVKDYEVILKRKDGKPIIALVTASTLSNARREVTGYLGFVRDITSQRQIEMQLIHAQKMESIGTLAGGIAHDFNNVLSMILSAAELMKKAAAGDDRQHRYCEMITDATARGTSIAKQLLVFARSQPMDLKPLVLSDIVDEILVLMEHSLPKTIVITKQYGPKDGPILGDSGLLHQALMNLAINAKDAMPAGGDLVFSIGSADADVVMQKFPQAAESSYVTLSVCDTGMGMMPMTQTRIFEPFFSTKERGKGTGLGLAIVHGIVKNHNGFIDVRSTQGQGTTFTMYFPAAAKIDQHNQPQSVEPGPGGSETILVVDDEQFIRDTIFDILTDFGYHVVGASNGVEALQIYAARQEEIALVITDLGMPGITGEELFVKLQQINPDVKTVVSTGYLEHLTKRDMLEMGVLDVIQKPFNISQILQVVRKALDFPNEHTPA